MNWLLLGTKFLQNSWTTRKTGKSTIQTKNAANDIRLNDKYQHVYMNDVDADEIRRIVHCEWSTSNRPREYVVVAQFIAKKSGDNESSDEDKSVSYFINDEL